LLLVLVLSLAWYGLQIHAIRDLLHRPRVRGNKKALWALLILCVPIAGALIYLSAGPTSFMPRDGRSRPARQEPPT
jgi:hypothetical protein